MSADWITGRSRVDMRCTIEIEHTFDSLHAHVTLDQEIQISPGSEVIVHGEPVCVPFGGRAVLRREATVVSAGWFDRISTRLKSKFQLTELYEVSFSSWRML